MRNENKRIMSVVVSFGMLLFGLLLAGCSQTGAGDFDKDAIEEVLELQFNGPDEEFIDLMWNPEYKTVVDGAEVNEKFDKYLQETYGEYFTESALDTFMRTFGGAYQSFAHSNDYTLNLKGVTIEESENVSNKYTFTAQVSYQKESGEEEIADVEGVVLFSTAEKKIGKFEYENDSGLSDELRK